MSNAKRTAPNSARRRPAWLARATVALLPFLSGASWIVPVLAAAPSARAQAVAKIVEGKVYGSGSTPLPGSIVYLQDQKTNVVKTFIATGDGSYRFGQLPADTDYKIWARYKDKQSKSKVISSFDTKLDVTIDFHVK